MILTQIIITFLLIIFVLLCGQTIKEFWEASNEEQKESIAKSVQGIFKAVKK